ncbi:MAPEG family protein [Paracoccus sp. (in: a-proteobacteria)]|uniref:MAPEG family protein n=1 Tax=Paracoccus sp. TaxID=267 RepID=UPI002898FF74|nr:MAPEG family protein [Paracoccus sp. (in: a-proteobacteria)]
MSAETTALGLAAILQAVQIGLAGMSMNRDVGAKWNAGPRDTQPALSARTGRLRRAVTNHFEALAFFTIAVLMVSLEDRSDALTVFCAWLYLAARILYVPAYAFGWSPWRSVIWGVGFLATMAMIVIALLT